jgi:portal protein
MTEEQLLSDAKAVFQLCEEAEAENRIAALDDLRVAKLGEQWPESVRQQRIGDGRACLTINRQPAFIRQAVYTARQNRPGIKVHSVDGEADVEIAEIYNGLIRNIEQTSKADVAYDTAVDCAVSNGFGYFRINTDYADEAGFDLELRIERIAKGLNGARISRHMRDQVLIGAGGLARRRGGCRCRCRGAGGRG